MSAPKFASVVVWQKGPVKGQEIGEEVLYVRADDCSGCDGCPHETATPINAKCAGCKQGDPIPREVNGGE